MSLHFDNKFQHYGYTFELTEFKFNKHLSKESNAVRERAHHVMKKLSNTYFHSHEFTYLSRKKLKDLTAKHIGNQDSLGGELQTLAADILKLNWNKDVRSAIKHTKDKFERAQLKKMRMLAYLYLKQPDNSLLPALLLKASCIRIKIHEKGKK
jgi:hypothetical protein